MSPNLVFNFAKSVIYSAVITFSFSGCGVFYSLNEEPEWSRMERKLNRDPFHVNSCGPTALNDAFSHLGIKVTNLEISEQIQKDGSILRDVMSAFTKEARRITFPSEIKSQLKEKGFEFIRLNSFSELKPEDTALILIHKKGTLSLYHWICFPVEKNILSFFGEDTVVDIVYLIK